MEHILLNILFHEYKPDPSNIGLVMHPWQYLDLTSTNISWLRATVYGALIIYPSLNTNYPFARPDRQIPVVLGMLQRFYFLCSSNSILWCLISRSNSIGIEIFKPCLHSQENGGIGILSML
jgi:hypothetical protein